MTRVEIAFPLDGPEAEPFHVEETALMAWTRPHRGQEAEIHRMVPHALDQALGTRPFEAAAADVDRVLLLVDDSTRETPTAAILPHMHERLQRAGVADDALSVLVAQGTHRPMDRSELEAKLGPDLIDRCRILQHDHQDPDLLIDRGTTADGMPVVVHREIIDHDLVVGIGSVGVHGLMGYSGGNKIALIGAGGEAVEAWTHWQAATRYQTAELLGTPENPLRRNLDEGGRMVGLNAVLNVALDPRGRAQHVAYGAPEAVHRKLIPYVQASATVEMPAPADVVVVDCTPATRDYWQSIKGLYAGAVAVRDGGAILLVAKNPEGIADNHPNVGELAGLPYGEIVDRVEAGEVSDGIGAAVAAITARTRRRARIYMVTSGITDQDVRALGIEPARSVQEALEAATTAVAARPKVAVIEQGGRCLPVVGGVNDHLVGRTLHAEGH